MNLRGWGLGRVALAWAYYWLLLGATLAASIAYERWRVARAYDHTDFGFAYTVEVRAGALLLFVPPLALTGAWLWLRRRR